VGDVLRGRDPDDRTRDSARLALDHPSGDTVHSRGYSSRCPGDMGDRSDVVAKRPTGCPVVRCYRDPGGAESACNDDAVADFQLWEGGDGMNGPVMLGVILAILLGAAGLAAFVIEKLRPCWGISDREVAEGMVEDLQQEPPM
jgi:hypothetical protein